MTKPNDNIITGNAEDVKPSDPTSLSGKLVDLYTRRATTLQTLYDLQCKTLEYKHVLDGAKQAIIAGTDPKELGSNEAQRAASIALQTEADQDIYNGAVWATNTVTHELALVDNELAMYKELRRIWFPDGGRQ